MTVLDGLRMSCSFCNTKVWLIPHNSSIKGVLKNELHFFTAIRVNGHRTDYIYKTL